MDKKLLLILSIGFIIRLMFAPFFGHPFDMFVWLSAGEMYIKHSINIYSVEEVPYYPWGFYAYPPLWLYWLSISAWFLNFIPSINFFAFIVKLPIILADLLIAIILYRYAKLFGIPLSGVKMAALWFLNPLTIFLSSIWGMFDSIAVLFALLGVVKLLEGKKHMSAILLGAGAAVKIFPVILILPALLYMRRIEVSKFKKDVFGYILYFLIIPVISSIPFLNDPVSYLRRLLFHFNNVGQFTYWVVLSSFIDPSILGFVSTVLMVAVIIFISLRVLHTNDAPNNSLINNSALFLLAFLSTSAKVNVQYLTWVLPFLIIILQKDSDRILKLNVLTLYISGIIFLIATIGLVNGYDLRYIGNLTNLESSNLSIFGSLTIAAALLGSSRIISSLFYFLNLKKIDVKIISKWTVLVLILLFTVMTVTFPTAKGVKLENMAIRIGIVESPDSAFIFKEDYGVEEFLKNYDVTHVVLPFSIDFVNTYGSNIGNYELLEYFKFRLGPVNWKVDDVKGLIKALKDKGVSVLLGIYLKPEVRLVRYGVQGYSSPWLMKDHRELLDDSSCINFCSIVHPDGKFVVEEQVYAEYFVSKVKRIINDFGFDGVYLIGWKGEGDFLSAESIYCLLDKLGEVRLASRIVIVGDLPYDTDPSIINYMLDKVDYVVVRTSPFYDLIHSKNFNVKTLDEYIDVIKMLSANISKISKRGLLFTVYAMDIAEGWMTPAIALQEEVDAFSSIGCFDGYVIVHSNKYLPYRITNIAR